MAVVTRKFIGLDWDTPVDAVRREPFNTFNYILDENYKDFKYPDLWKSTYRGLGIYTNPTESCIILGVKQQVSILTHGDSNGDLGGKYFDISAANDTTIYRVWIDVNNTSTAPAAIERTLVEVDIALNATAPAVATAIDNALGAITDFDVLTDTVFNNKVVVTNATEGPASAPNAKTSGFTIELEANGIDTTEADNPTTIRAMADGTIIHVGNGAIGILHENAGQQVTSFYVYVTPTYYVNCTTQQETVVGQKVSKRDPIGSIIDRGSQTLLYIEMYSGFVNNYSSSSVWGLDGARPLLNDQYLLDPGNVIGDSFALISTAPAVTSLDPSSGPIFGSRINQEESVAAPAQDTFILPATLPIVDWSGIETNESEDIAVRVNGVLIDPADYSLVGSTGTVVFDTPLVGGETVTITYRHDEPPFTLTAKGNSFFSATRVFFGQDIKSNSSRLNGILDYVMGATPTLPVEVVEGLVTFVSSNQIFIDLPPSPIENTNPGIEFGTDGLVDIAFINPEEALYGVLVLESGFRYNPLPEIVSISPTSGPEVGGNQVTITGSNFNLIAQVKLFNSVNANVYTFPAVTFISTGELKVTMPDRVTAGLPVIPAIDADYLVGFIVSNSTLEATFTDIGDDGTPDVVYRYLPAPEITSTTPTSGVTSGSSPSVPNINYTITVTGSNFRTISTDEFILNEDITIESLTTTVTVNRTPIVKHNGGFEDTGTLANLSSDIIGYVVYDETGLVQARTITTVDGATGTLTFNAALEEDWVLRISYYYNRLVSPQIFIGEAEARVDSFDVEPSATEAYIYYPPNSEGSYPVIYINPDRQSFNSEVDAGVPFSFTYIRNDDPMAAVIIPANLESTEDLDNTYPDEDAGDPF